MLIIFIKIKKNQDHVEPLTSLTPYAKRNECVWLKHVTPVNHLLYLLFDSAQPQLPAKLLCHTCVTPQEGQNYSSYQYASGTNRLPSKDESPLQTSLQCWPWTRTLNLHCKSRHIPSCLQFACSFTQKPQLLMTPGVWLLKRILQCHKGRCLNPLNSSTL